MTYLLVTVGGIVCVTDSSRGCPDWPGCYGKIVPPLRADAIIESVHRVLAALTSVLIVAAATVGWFKSRTIRWVSWPPLIAVALLLVVIMLGALVVLRGLSPGMAAVDLGSALSVQALMLTATVVALVRRDTPALPDRLWLHSPFAKLTLYALVATFIVLVSSVLVAGAGSAERCLGWPLYGGWLPAGPLDSWLRVVRRWFAGGTSILIIAVVVQAWRTQRANMAILRAASAVGILLLAEATAGALLEGSGPAVLLLGVHAALAAALWALMIVLAVLAGLAPYPVREKRPGQPSTGKGSGVASESPRQ